jgi:hypothetical protein
MAPRRWRCRKQFARIDDAMKRSHALALSSMGYKAQDFFPTAWMLKVLGYYDEGRMAEFQDQEDGLKKHFLEKKASASGSAYVSLQEAHEKFEKARARDCSACEIRSTSLVVK